MHPNVTADQFKCHQSGTFKFAEVSDYEINKEITKFNWSKAFLKVHSKVCDNFWHLKAF